MKAVRKILSAIALILLCNTPCIAGDMNPPQLIGSSFGSEFDPAVSPDGRYLAYTSDASGNEDIWLFDIRDGMRRKVTRNSSSDYAPCFLGNDRLLFVSTRASSDGEIYLSDLKGEDIRKIIGGDGYFDSPAVSPDRKTIAYIHKKGDENIRIYFLDLKSRETKRGPVGVDPAFAPSGESIIFISADDRSDDSGQMARYFPSRDSIRIIDAGPGVVSNPAFYPDGKKIIFASHTADLDKDGSVTRNDNSELMTYDLEDIGSASRFYAGFYFGKPAVSSKGQIFAVSDDADIYSLSADGLAPQMPGASEQSILCDSLLRRLNSQNDSLMAAGCCLSAYNHYPDTCMDYLLLAADLYAALGMIDLALDILEPATESHNRGFAALATLKAGKIRFSAFKSESQSKAWYDAHQLARYIIDSEGLRSEIVKEAYLFGIEVSHVSGRFQESNSLIVEALLRHTGDDIIAAILEMWRLRNITETYVGDPMDLIPLYFEYLDWFTERPALLDSAISDLIELTRILDDDIAVGELENIQTSYPANRKLSAAALYEQGERFFKSGRRELAGWKYRAIIADFPEYPIPRFQAFKRLGHLRMAEEDLEAADAYFDSAQHYLGHIESYSSRLNFQREVGSLKTIRGYNVMDRDPRKAEIYFRQALDADLENYEALWGLAKALAEDDGWNRWEDVGRTIADENKRMYFLALKYITEYEIKRKAGSLEKARRLLLKVIEQDYRFPPAYLSLGYVDCLVESGSEKALGLYEEAVDISMRGVSLSRQDPILEAAFLLNAAEAYYGLGQFRMAYENYMQSINTDSTLIMDTGAKSLLIKLGESAFQIDSLKQASAYYENIYLQAAAASDGRAQAVYAGKLGVIYQLMGRYLTALEYYEAAFPYYSSKNDHQMMANVTKSAAVCYASFGNDSLAAEAARRALGYLGRVKDHKTAFEDRIKLIIWPFGLEIPTFKLEPMNYGGSLYPRGFSMAANRALLTKLGRRENSDLDAVNTDKEILEIFSQGEEKTNSGSIWNVIGRAYFDMGHPDSAAAAFSGGYRLSIELDDYINAYIDLTNWAVAALSPAAGLSSESHIRSLSKLKEESLKLFGRIPPAYGPARANLKNIAGVAEFKLSLIKMSAPIESDVDFERWIESLRAYAEKYLSSLEGSRFLFREGISEVAFGDDPGLAASLSLNEAVLSLAIGDKDGYRTAISRAVEEATLSGSEAIYARAVGVKSLHSEMDLEDRRDLITRSLTSFESLRPGQLMLHEMPLIENLYSGAVAIALESEDSLSALGYLEQWRGLELLNMMNLLSLDYAEGNLLRAYIRQARSYLADLARLGADQRRLEALGISGQIELKRTKEKTLALRSQFLDIKEKISEINSIVSSRLFLDIPSPLNVIRSIPSEEICIIPFGHSDEAILWLCDSTGIETMRVDLNENNLRERMTAKFRHKKVVSIALNDTFGDRLKNTVRRAFPKMKIKNCFSLAEAYGEKRQVPLKLDGLAVVRSEGFIIPDSIMIRSGAGFLTPDMLLDSGTYQKYGWLVFDGKLHFDRQNPLMSYWNYDGVSDSVNLESNFYINDLFRISTASSGAVILNYFENSKTIEKWAVLKAFFDAGLRTVITIPGSLGESKSLKLIGEFSSNIEEFSALESFSLARQAIMETTDSTGEEPEYYGHSGWDSSDREHISVAWYNESLFAGYQASIRGNWRKAVEYYTLAQRQSKTAGLSAGIVKSITKRLVDAYLNLDDYENALNAQMSLTKIITEDTATLISEWQRYQEIAFEAGELDKSILALRRMIELANSIRDTSQLAKFYLELAKSYYVQNEISTAVESAGKAIELSHTKTDSVVLAGGFFIRGRAYLKSGSYLDAESDLKSAISIYEEADKAGDQHAAKMSLGEVYDRIERYMSGRRVFESALKYFIDTGDSLGRRRCLHLLADNYLKSWQSHEARKYVDLILEEDAGDPHALMLLSEIMYRTGLQDSSYKIGLRALKAAHASQESGYVSRAHYNLGNILYSMNDFDLAADQYMLALEFQNRDSVAGYSDPLLYKLAATRAKRGNDQDSVFMKIRKDSPDEFIRGLCGYQVGIGMLADGKREAAREIFMEILESDDNRTARILKWRSLFNIGLTSDDEMNELFFLKADSVSRRYPPEPEFIRDEYALDIGLNDLFQAIAGVKLEAGDLASAIDYYERGFCSKLATLHLSSGNFSDKEIQLIDNYRRSVEQNLQKSFRGTVTDFLSGQPRYGPLWGEPESSVEGLKRILGISQGVIRFYERPASTILFYVDRDTIAYNIIEIGGEEISNTAELLPQMLKYQVKGDSALEGWYRMIILPFEDLMEKSVEILLVPDGSFIRLPLEALKRPDADYLVEMFSITRSVHLPMKFPAGIDRELSPCFDKKGRAEYDLAMGIVNSLSEAVGCCTGNEDDYIRFSTGRNGLSYDDVKGAVLCYIQPAGYERDADWQLGTLRARRDGYEGAIQTLWEIPNQALSHYYWILLNGLRQGKGLRESHRAAASYVFGRYRGVPYYWAYGVPYSLN